MKQEVLDAIREAERLAVEAKNAADRANAVVGTWWKSDSRPWLQSEDLLMAATLTRSIAHHLRMRAEEAMEKTNIIPTSPQMARCWSKQTKP